MLVIDGKLSKTEYFRPFAARHSRQWKKSATPLGSIGHTSTGIAETKSSHHFK